MSARDAKADNLKAAIERAKLRRVGVDVSSDDDWHDPTCDGIDNAILADELLRRIAADEVEQAECGKAIDEAWLRCICDEEHFGAFAFRAKMLGAIVPACGESGYTWEIGDVHVMAVKTRGQLLDLLRALGIDTKGGA